MDDGTGAAVTTCAAAGITNAVGEANVRSESWQQFMVHIIIPGISCPQSMWPAAAAGILW